MKKVILLSLFALISFNSNAYAESIATYNPVGIWLTENERSVIEIEKCGDALCGYIAWIIDGGLQYDEKNPEENLRGQPMCGLQIVQGLKQAGPGSNKWQGGKIYKADDGDIYDATLTMKASDKLKVRGYIGISLLGKSQKWTRVDSSHYPRCRAPKS